MTIRLVYLLLSLFAFNISLPARAHDASAWGGLFRSRDFGANWFPVDAGLFIGGALGAAIHPRDPAQLLYGTDARLLRSKNGGRDWRIEAAANMSGAVFAVAFDSSGSGALASSGTRILYSDDGVGWQEALAPGGATPVRVFARSLAQPDRLYLAGARGLFLSDDRGRSWARVGAGVLPEAAVTALIIMPGLPENVYALINGDIWMSDDGVRNWDRRAAGLPAGQTDTLFADAGSAKLWSTASAQVFASDNGGITWTAYGRALPEPATQVRGIAVSSDGKILVLSTHRGVLRSTDSGQNWNQVESSLPVHLESGMLVRDPHDAATLYAGFSLTPYQEMWRRAEQGGSLLARLDPVSLAGGVAFFVSLIIIGILCTRWLLRRAANATPRVR